MKEYKITVPEHCAFISYDLNDADARYDYQLAVNARKIHSVLWEMAHQLRSVYKHDQKNFMGQKFVDSGELAQIVAAEIWELIEED